ncbi:unnamed protein product, partial [marine sediment metagenome]
MVQAYILITAAIGKVRQVAEELEGLQGVKQPAIAIFATGPASPIKPLWRRVKY